MAAKFRVKLLSRNPDDYLRETKRDIHKGEVWSQCERQQQHHHANSHAVLNTCGIASNTPIKPQLL